MQHLLLRARELGLGLVLALALAGCVRSGLPQVDAKEIQQVVQAQLEAFAADDANRAFALADPTIRSRYESAQQYLAMVRSEYPMVHRARAVRFLKPEGDGKLVVQRVRLSDPVGMTWTATYFLQKQQDAQWRISACLVAAENAQVMV